MCNERTPMIAHGFTDEYVKQLAFEATGRNVEWVKPCQVSSSATGTQAPLPFMLATDPSILTIPNEAFFGVVRAAIGIGGPSGAGLRTWVGALYGPDDYNMGRPVVPFMTMFAANALDNVDALPAHPPCMFYKVGQMPGLNVLWYFTGFRIRFNA